MSFKGNVSRRTFVKSSALALTSSFLPILRQPRGRSLGVALVGLGYYSTDLLAPALQQTMHCHLAGIVTGSPEKIPVWQQKYGIPDANVYDYGNMDKIANNPAIDVIYIVLPIGMHAEYTIKAANTGKHVWCEKAMATTAAECQAMIDACKANKVNLSIGYRMQHEPNTRTVMKFSQSKPYGRIREIMAEAGYREGRTTHWKQNKAMGGGCMLDMGVYPLNAARYTAGAEPLAVTARHETTRQEIYHEVDEITYFDLEFPGGTIARCKTSFAEGLNHLRADCESGWYELKPFQAYNGVRGVTSDGLPLNQTIANQQARQMDDDALAIINNTEVMVPGEEGLRDISIVEAIYRSAATNQRITL